MHRHKKRIPFGERSRRQRKVAFISVKNDIRRHANILGGLFFTHDYLHGKNGWIDCTFLGRKKPVFYNCVLDTTRNAYKEQVRELAYKRSYVLAIWMIAVALICVAYAALPDGNRAIF